MSKFFEEFGKAFRKALRTALNQCVPVIKLASGGLRFGLFL